DLAAVAAVDDVDLRIGVDIAHEPHAPRAEDAAVAVEHQRRSEVDVCLDPFAIEYATRKFHAAQVGAERIGKILQRALAALVADRAIKWVVDQQELEHAGARLDDVGRPSGHHHAFRADRRTGGLQLRHLLDLDDADAARAVDADARVVTVIGHFDPGFDGGLEDRLPFLDGQRPAVYRE